MTWDELPEAPLRLGAASEILEGLRRLQHPVPPTRTTWTTWWAWLTGWRTAREA